jgi:hypothetical protein
LAFSASLRESPPVRQRTSRISRQAAKDAKAFERGERMTLVAGTFTRRARHRNDDFQDNLGDLGAFA